MEEECNKCGKKEDEMTIITNCPEESDEESYCLDCCQKIFEEGYCGGSCDLPFVVEKRKSIFEKIFKNPNYEFEFEILGPFDKKELGDGELIYVNSDKTIAFGFGMTGIIFFENIKLDEFKEVKTFFRGHSYFFIKHKQEVIAFDLDGIKFAEKLFEEFDSKINISDFTNTYTTNGQLLLLIHDNIWFLFSQDSNQQHFFAESQNFQDDFINGLNFFSLDITNRLDWSKLSDREFEELIAELLIKNSYIKNVELFGGRGGDNKRDIVCNEIINTITGTTLKKLVIECKHQKESVSQKPISDVIKLHGIHKANKYLFVTSSKFTNEAKDMINGWNNSEHYPFEAAYWERQNIEKMLEQSPDLILKYFGTKS